MACLKALCKNRTNRTRRDNEADGAVRVRNKIGLPRPAAVLLGVILLANIAFSQTPEAVSSPSALKKLSLEDLMNMEVTTVSKRSEQLAEAASAIQVITQEDIRRAGATSIPEALRLAPNLQVAQVDSRQWAITSRGFNGTAANKLLVLIDGRSVYTPLFSGVFWDVQDTLLDDIDRIEVISGPGGTLWGANAVNGVINIITKNAKDTQGLLVSAGGGSLIHDFGGVRYGGKIAEQGFYRAYVKHFDRDSSRLPDGKSASDGWQITQGGFRSDWAARGENAFTLQGDAYDGSIAQPNARDTRVDGGNIVGRWSKSFSDVSSVRLQVYYDHSHREVPSLFREDLDAFDVDFQHRFPWGVRQDVMWGMDYRLAHDHVGNSPILAFLPPKLTTHLVSGFLQDEITLARDRLKLALGTKLEHNDFSGFEYQPSGRLSLRVTDGQTLWGAISRAVRTPSRIDRDFFFPAGLSTNFPNGLAGGPGFKSEKLIAYELGYRVRPHDRVTVSLAAFYNDYDDLRSVEVFTNAPGLLANGLKGDTFGAELATTYHAARWLRLHAGYTFLEMQLRTKAGSLDTTSTDQKGDSPRHQFLLRSSLDLADNIEFDATARYVDDLPHYLVPAYWAVDLRLAYSPCKNLELAIVGQNLLHKRHPEFGSPAQEIQRSVYGKVTWSF